MGGKPRDAWVDQLDWIYLHGPIEIEKVRPSVLNRILEVELMVDVVTIDGMKFVDLNGHGKYFMGEDWS